MHSCGIIHNNIVSLQDTQKPRTVKVNNKDGVMICDFNKATTIHELVDRGLESDYVINRWYRSPQSLLDPNYNKPSVDVWGVGCIGA